MARRKMTFARMNLTGSVGIEGAFKNGDDVYLLVKAEITAEPHPVATASSGDVIKTSAKLVTAMLAPDAVAEQVTTIIDDAIDEQEGKKKLPLDE